MTMPLFLSWSGFKFSTMSLSSTLAAAAFPVVALSISAAKDQRMRVAKRPKHKFSSMCSPSAPLTSIVAELPHCVSVARANVAIPCAKVPLLVARVVNFVCVACARL